MGAGVRAWVEGMAGKGRGRGVLRWRIPVPKGEDRWDLGV